MSTMLLDEYRAALAEDCQRLQAALGGKFPHQRMAQQLMRADFADAADCALDLAIEGADTKERVAIQLAAKKGGYSRPWNRDARSRVRIVSA